MAPSRFTTAQDVALLVLLGLLHEVACSEDSAAAPRALVAMPTMPPRPNTVPDCKDPLTDKGGYEPMCPPGYFRCCATCKGATCFSEKGLHRSWRGINECAKCAAGDYCKGCDTYKRCRPSEIPGRKGPRISPPGSTRSQDCDTCPAGYEADLHRRRCVKKWKDVCNEKYVGRCVRNCRAEEAKRMKNLNTCEAMKCQLYCAKRWSDACLETFGAQCEILKKGPSAYDLDTDAEDWLTDCNVDCSSALSHNRLHSLTLIWFALAAMTATFRGSWGE